MSYVEHCDQHGQYKGDYCDGCVEATQMEVESLRAQLEKSSHRISFLEKEIGNLKDMKVYINRLWIDSGLKNDELRAKNALLLEALEMIWTGDWSAISGVDLGRENASEFAREMLDRLEKLR